MRWLVDGTNLLGSRPDGWWRDRPAAMRRLVEQLDRFARTSGDEVLVVFDGRPLELDTAAVKVRFASRAGPDAADDDIAALAARDPDGVRVVTSDRELAERARAAGADVVGAGSFRRELEGLPPR